MTGLFPWEHICHLCGARPKCWRGITNKDYKTGGKINHTNDDSKRALRQNVKMASSPLVFLFPLEQKPGGQQQGFLWVAFCRHNIPNNLMWVLEVK